MRKSAVLGVFLVILSGVAVADHYTFPDETVQYGETVDIDIECDGDSKTECNGGFAINHELYVCGEQVDTTSGDSFGATDVYSFSVNVPSDAACSLGEHELRFVPEGVADGMHEATGGSLTVQPDSMDPNVGRVLRVALDTDDSPTQLHNFYLTNTQREVREYDGMDEDSDGLERIVIRQVNDGFGASDGISHLDESYLKDEKPLILERSTNSRLDDIVDWDHDVFESDLLKQDFTDSNDETLDGPLNADSSTPLHRGQDYMPEGDIIYGHYPEYYSSYDPYNGEYVESINSGEGPFFFICREGATMYSYTNQVPQVVNVNTDGSSELYRCDQESGKWIGPDDGDEVGFSYDNPTTECNDGLDNDGDGYIDHENSHYHEENLGTHSRDENCRSPSDNSESYGSLCETGVTKDEITYTSNTGQVLYRYQGLVAQYKIDQDTCSTDGTIYHDDEIVYTNWINGKEPDVTWCIPGSFDPICQGVNYGPYEQSASGIPVSTYYAEREYFKQLADEQGVDLENGGVVDTGFVNPWGWTSQTETLWEAELDYSRYGIEHDYSTWKDRGIKEPEVSDAYDNDDTYNNIEAWNVENAGVTNNDVYTPENPDSEEEIFKGGFAGKCSEGEQWRYEEDPLESSGGEWLCSGDVDWTQPVMLPEVQGNTIGLVVMPFNAMDQRPDYLQGVEETRTWLPYREATHPDVNPEWPEDSLESLEAMCWPGDSEDRPDRAEAVAGEDYIYAESVSVTDEGPFGIYGDVDMSGHTSYSCNWSYTTSEASHDIVPKPMTEVGTLFKMHKNMQHPATQALLEQHPGITEFDFQSSSMVQAG